MKTKEEKALEYAHKCDPLNQMLEKQADVRMGYLAGYEAAEKDAREKAIKVFCQFSCGEKIVECFNDCNMKCKQYEQFINNYDNA